MTNQQILTKAIQKAIEGGWYTNGIRVCGVSYGLERGFHDVTFTVDVKGGEITESWNLYELIFNHDFAKALWGEEITDWVSHYLDDKSDPDPPAIPLQNWVYHLQQMVIADDPVVYLGEHLE